MKNVNSKEVSILVTGPFNKPFDYVLEDENINLSVGQIVLVPFGKRKIVGIIMGVTGGNMVAIIFNIPAVIPIDWAVIGLVVCSAIGIGFGIYPAWRAAQLDPIESLRFE